MEREQREHTRTPSLAGQAVISCHLDMSPPDKSLHLVEMPVRESSCNAHLVQTAGIQMRSATL